MVKPKYYLVERTLLPEVFQRVIEANEAIASGKAFALSLRRLPTALSPTISCCTISRVFCRASSD